MPWQQNTPAYLHEGGGTTVYDPYGRPIFRTEGTTGSGVELKPANIPDSASVNWGGYRLRFDQDTPEEQYTDNVYELFEPEPSMWPWVAAGAGVLAIIMLWRR